MQVDEMRWSRAPSPVKGLTSIEQKIQRIRVCVGVSIKPLYVAKMYDTHLQDDQERRPDAEREVYQDVSDNVRVTPGSIVDFGPLF